MDELEALVQVRAFFLRQQTKRLNEAKKRLVEEELRRMRFNLGVPMPVPPLRDIYVAQGEHVRAKEMHQRAWNRYMAASALKDSFRSAMGCW